MSCRRIERLIQEVASGVASERDRAAVEAHAAQCAACARALLETRRLVAWLAAMPPREVSPGFDANLRAALERSARRDAARSVFAAWSDFRTGASFRTRGWAVAGALPLLAAAVAAPRVAERQALQGVRSRYVSAAVERHRQLQSADSRLEWEAVDASIELAAGSIVTE